MAVFRRALRQVVELCNTRWELNRFGMESVIYTERFENRANGMTSISRYLGLFLVYFIVHSNAAPTLNKFIIIIIIIDLMDF